MTNQGRGKLPVSPPLHYIPTPAKGQCCSDFFVRCRQGSFFFNSFNRHGNEASALWLSFLSKFLKYFIIYKRFPYWLRTGKNMNVQNLRVLIKISMVIALAKQRLFLKDLCKKIRKKHSFIMFIFTGVSFSWCISNIFIVKNSWNTTPKKHKESNKDYP